MRILVVEDHAETRHLVERALKKLGHAPEGVADLRSARKRLEGGGLAAIVLDWMLPDGAGIELCEELRAMKETIPILILTARGDVHDRVRGLDAGADDYLRKPFALAELEARVRALLRRGPRLESPVVRIGSVEVRPQERRVFVSKREVALTAKEYSILEVLLRSHGRAVHRSDILAFAWGDVSESFVGSLEVLIARLRRKLAVEGSPDSIRTHRGYGYSIGQEE